MTFLEILPSWEYFPELVVLLPFYFLLLDRPRRDILGDVLLTWIVLYTSYIHNYCEKDHCEWVLPKSSGSP